MAAPHSPFSAEMAAGLVGLIAGSRDGLPPAGAYKDVLKATSSMQPEIVAALFGGAATQRADGWFEGAVVPAANFRSVICKPGTPVDIAFSLKSGRFISSAAPSARLGLLDLAAHIWALRAPDLRLGADVRMLALIGLAFLQASAEQPPKNAEAA